MATVAETARVVMNQPRDLTDDIARNAWLLWQSVTNECLRKRARQTADGYWVYVGTMRWHTVHLWPMLEEDERKRLERELYSYLARGGMARNIKRRDPTVWHVAVTWQTPTTATVVSVPVFRMSRAEKRVTPEEAGETLPPAAVTVRTTKGTDMRQKKKDKEAPAPVTAEEAGTAERVSSSRRDYAEERQVRRDLICELFAQVTQPLVAEEIAFNIGIEVSGVRKELIELEKAGKLFSRTESNEERQVRYGGVARAQRASLWSTENPVPERTEREAVEGFVRDPALVVPLARGEVARRFAQFFKDKSTRYVFTAAQVSEKTGMSVGTVRARVVKWCEAGIMERTNVKKMNYDYRIVDKQALFDDLGQAHLLIKKVVEPVDPAPVAPPVPEPTPGFDLLARAGEILDENERLRHALTDARTALTGERATSHRLKAENDQLQAELAELRNRPSVDAETANRLREWQPVPSV